MIEIENKDRKKFYILLGLLIIFTIATSYWVITDKNKFLFDDYSWLNVVKFKSYSEIFKFLPVTKYNDRPLGALLIKLLYDIFNLNYVGHHYILLAIHLLNTLMVMSICNVFFKKNAIKNYYIYSIIAASIFGIYPKALMCVQWDAAIFDLLGATFCLITILFYLKYIYSDKYKNFNMIMSLFFYYLGLRTKEMIITLPVIIIIYEIYIFLKEKKVKRITMYSRISSLVMIVYLTMLMRLPSANNITETVNSPYYLSFNPISIIKSLFKYIALYFDLKNSSFNYSGVNNINLIGIIGIVIILIVALYRLIKFKDLTLTICILCIGLSLAPVLPMKNMQHILYLYIPSIFIGILFAVLFIPIINNYKKIEFIVPIIIIVVLYLSSYTNSIINFRNYWSSLGSKDKMAIEDIKKIKKVSQNTSIYVEGIKKDDYTVFFYGPGFINNILFNDETIKTYTDNSSKKYPYVIWKYNDGRVSEVERNEEIKIIISNVYPKEIIGSSFNAQKNGESAISIEGSNLNEDCKIIINSKELEITYSPEFISTIVPKSLIQGKSSLDVCVKNFKNNVESNHVIIPIK